MVPIKIQISKSAPATQHEARGEQKAVRIDKAQKCNKYEGDYKQIRVGKVFRHTQNGLQTHSESDSYELAEGLVLAGGPVGNMTGRGGAKTNTSQHNNECSIIDIILKKHRSSTFHACHGHERPARVSHVLRPSPTLRVPLTLLCSRALSSPPCSQ